MKARALLLACVLGTIPTVAFAQGSAPAATKAEAPETILTVGDNAPAMTIEKWVRGEPITGFEKGKVYIVEFWATWCGPCIDGIPHLTELQEKYKDKGVTVIGVTSPDRRNTPEAVEKLVKSQNDNKQMLYTIAWDGSKQTSKNYMKAAMQGGIPCAFLVDREGRIAYIGHPMNMDDALAAVVKGDWDISKEKSRYEAEQAKDRRLNTFMQNLVGGNAKAAYAIAPQLLDDNKDDAGTLNMIAWTIVDPDGPVKDRDLAVALKAAVRANELTKGEEASILDTLARIHFLQGDIDQAIQIQEKAIALTEVPGERDALKKSLDEYKAAKK